MLRSTWLVGLLLWLLPGAATSLPSVALDLDPATHGIQTLLERGVGASFTLEVLVFDLELASPLKGYELQLGFEPGLFDALDATDGDLLADPVLEVERILGPMSVRLVELSLAAGGVTGSGVLARVDFVTTNVGTALLSLEQLLLSSPFGQTIPFSAPAAVTLQVVPEPGTALLLAAGLTTLSHMRRRRWTSPPE